MFTKYVSEWAKNLRAIVGVTTFGPPCSYHKFKANLILISTRKNSPKTIWTWSIKAAVGPETYSKIETFAEKSETIF